MSARSKYRLRVAFRLVWMSAEFLLAAVRFPWFVAFRTGNRRTLGRSEWLRLSSRRILRILGIHPQSEGAIPSRGLLVSQHLSYLDIPVLASLTPALFVSKREVRAWPILGWFAQIAGTVFVHRERRAQAVEAAVAIEALLNQDALVVLFPEGTSSNGDTVLPFKSSLLEPAAHNRCPLSVARIEYGLEDGDVGEDVCYWRDVTFAGHALNLLSKRRIWAKVRFRPLPPLDLNRKELAIRLRDEVMTLRSSEHGRAKTEDLSFPGKSR